MPDFYDPDPKNKTDPADPLRNEPPFTFNTGADRTSRKMQSFIDDMRARNALVIGCGETSAVTPEELQLVWQTMRDNRDIWAVGSYFNSFNNSRWDWRLIPRSYPAQNPDQFNADGTLRLRDHGGSTTSEAKLAVWQAALDESLTAVGPLGG